MVLPGARVLVVDDNVVNRVVLRRLLARADISPSSIVEASCGESAFEAYQENLTSHGTISLILMDLIMPGVDGWEACERIRRLEAQRAHGSGAYIAAVTSEDISPGSFALQRCWDCGMDAVMGKAVNLDNIIELLRLACTLGDGEQSCRQAADDEACTPDAAAVRLSLEAESQRLPGRLQQILCSNC